MTSGFFSNGVLGGLAFRVLLFLSLALLPIGLIAVLQNREIAEQSQSAAELSLYGVTEQATQAERAAIQEAAGAAQALASIIELLADDDVRCSDFLERYRAGNPLYRMVGFIGVSGMMRCSSSGEVFDFSDAPGFARAAEQRERTVTYTENGIVTQEPSILVNVPVRADDEITGFISISIDRSGLEDQEIDTLLDTPLAVINYNREGTILTSHQADDVTEAELPQNFAPRQLTGSQRQVFSGLNRAGEERVYAVVPIVPNLVYAMSVWEVDTPLLQTDFTGRLSAILPFMMWVASLIVAFWALNRLAIRHITRLGRQMRHFALNRTLPKKPSTANVPQEIATMEGAFFGMANSILQDEARLEDSLRDKNILLKEVHHRVKNNLQLISSIMNMQIRQAPTEENRQVLQRLQDRILSLATVHKNLYQGDEMTRVDGGGLLKEIVARNLAVGLESSVNITVEEQYDPILISPDDAAPLTLLVSEAVTNAMKYVPRHHPGGAVIDISLIQIEEERAVLRVSNTLGADVPVPGTGLGSRLITAFSRQLNGQLDIEQSEDRYTLELSFPVPKADKMVYDY